MKNTNDLGDGIIDATGIEGNGLFLLFPSGNEIVDILILLFEIQN